VNIIVVGGSSGLGWECARKLAASHKVWCWSRRDISPHDTTSCRFDLAAYTGAPDATIDFPLTTADCLLIAGGMGAFYGPHQLSAEVVDKMFHTNARGPILLANRFLLMHRATKAPGRVVVVSSTAATNGGHGLGVYAASKAAVEAWIASEGRHQAKYEIDIVSAALGWFESPMTENLKPEVRKRAEARCPKGRFATLEEASDFVVSILASLKGDGGTRHAFWEPCK
jgi:NAD(P)-dependent dehydrogenase (short-subunit alcohol dehydrogenase family)